MGVHVKVIYHLLSRALGQRVPIPEIVDFNIFDVVTILLVHVGFEFADALARGMRSIFGDGALRLQGTVRISTAYGFIKQKLVGLTDRMGGTSTCWIPLLDWSSALILAAAAAVDFVVSHTYVSGRAQLNKV